MVIGAIVHFVVGDETLRKIGRLELPPNRFGSSADTRVVMRATWHFGTIAFAFLGAWLLATGLQPHASFALGVTYLSGSLLSCYALVGVVITLYRKGPTGLFRHPGPLTLSTAAALVWWGSTSL